MVDTYFDGLTREIKRFLKDRNLQVSKCGFKSQGLGSGHSINKDLGTWANENHSRNKPPRWLYKIDFVGGELSPYPASGEGFQIIGQANTAQGDKAGIILRILPLVSSGNSYIEDGNLEVYAFFVFRGAVPKGSSSQTFSFDPQSGEMSYNDSHLDYIHFALLSVQDPNYAIEVSGTGGPSKVSYGDIVHALSQSIATNSLDGASKIPVYDLTQKDEQARAFEDFKAAWMATDADNYPKLESTIDSLDDSEEEITPLSKVPEDPSLIGISDDVYRQINACLSSGKRHLMLYGPPGTGKTTIAKWIATCLGADSVLVTGSADWSSQDIIGGYQPIENGNIGFVPGVLLKNFDKPLIIDELNRCDIDKVIGPLFTVLSGQQSTLPYRETLDDPESELYTILPQSKPNHESYEFAPTPQWRLIATMNTVDKGSLYQMSYALSRRFGWIFVDVPEDPKSFISEFKAEKSEDSPDGNATRCALGDVWYAINKVRPLGAAPFIDVMNLIAEMGEGLSLFGDPSIESQAAFIDALEIAILPLLDGLKSQDAETLLSEIIEAYSLTGPLEVRLEKRLRDISF